MYQSSYRGFHYQSLELGILVKSPHTQQINWRYPGGPMAMQYALFSHQFNTTTISSITTSQTSYQNAIGLFYGAFDTKATVKNFVWKSDINGDCSLLKRTNLRIF